MRAKIEQTKNTLEFLYQDFKLSEALKTVYALIWNDFCSWYLEWVKPAQDKGFSKEAYNNTLALFEDLLQLLHPFMPFVTEEIFHLLRHQKEDLINRQLQAAAAVDEIVLQQGSLLQELITAIRDARNKNRLKPKDVISLFIDTQNETLYAATGLILQRQVNADKLELVIDAVGGALSLVVQTEKVYIQSHAEVNTDAQRKKLEEELAYQEGFLEMINKKLSNEKFVQNAKPEIIANEKNKRSDTEAKIKTLEESLALL
jgi:valyl-tRNA synthetase